MSQKPQRAGIVESAMLYIALVSLATVVHGESLVDCQSLSCALDSAGAEEMVFLQILEVKHDSSFYMKKDVSFVQLSARTSGRGQDDKANIVTRQTADVGQPEPGITGNETTDGAVNPRGEPTEPPAEAEAAENTEAAAQTDPEAGAEAGAITDGAQASGVTANKADDWKAFVAGVLFNFLFIVFCILFFMLGKRYHPEIYEHNVQIGAAPFQPMPSSLGIGWATAAVYVTIDEISETMGLDQAMLMDFVQMSMKIMAWIGIPMMVVIGPMNLFYGGNAAGQDYESYLSMNNVEDGSWLFSVDAVVVWYVVVVVKELIYLHMGRFLPRRFAWLEKLPVPRASTILVEGIPHNYQSDKMLKFFFSEILGPDAVTSAYCVRRATLLKAAYNRRVYAKKALDAAEFAWDKAGRDPDKRPKFFLSSDDQITHWSEEILDATEDERLERDRCTLELSTIGETNGCNGFVTFADPSDAEKAAKLKYSPDADKWQVGVAPPPESIRWRDLEQDPTGREMWALIGYALLAGLFCIYLPSVLWIEKVAASIQFKDSVMQSLWTGLAPTVGLQFMVCFLPSFLLIIFRLCFTLKDETFSQAYLQDWYYWFQLVFVILITAIGPSLFLFLKTLVVNPVGMFQILADTMPKATHFFMNFLVVGWASHALNLTRYMNIGKYLLFKRFFEAEEAREMAEPEDQDYYGLGSRNARFTIMISIGIIFGTLAPGINVLAFINFAFCRLFYGYLIPFAECKKPDLGGLFFVRACEHLLYSTVVYTVLMAGVLYGHAATIYPSIVAGSSLFYVIYSIQRFKTEFLYERLPYEELAPLLTGHKEKMRLQGASYIQPEWDFKATG